MISSPSRSAAIFGGIFLVSLTSFTASAEIVYDNTTTPLLTPQGQPKADLLKVEHGDQLQLGGTARTLTDIYLEYYSNATLEGGESLIIRLYDNVTPWDQFRRQPTNVLVEQAVPLRRGSNGYATAHVGSLNVVVPDTVTVTIQATGLEPEESFGFPLYYPMTTGSSFNEYWRRTGGGGWEAYSYLDPDFRLNGGIRLVAVPEPAVWTLAGLGLAAFAFVRRPGSKA